MECTDILQRGLVKREGFPDGYWFFEPNSDRFASRRGETLQAGQRIKIVVEEVDQINKRVNFKITKVIGGKSATKKTSRKFASKKKSARKTAAKKSGGKFKKDKFGGKKKAAPAKKSGKKRRR